MCAEVLSYAEDGSRLGQPAREVMAYEVMDPLRRTSAVLPNQDRNQINTVQYLRVGSVLRNCKPLFAQ